MAKKKTAQQVYANAASLAARNAAARQQLADAGYFWDGFAVSPLGAAEPEPIYYGGGGGGGGGGGVYAPPSLGRIDDSPDWQALMAELARQEGLYQAEAERQKAITIADRDRLLGELAQRGEIERENVAGAMEARGLYRSGETEQRIARQRANELARQTAITTAAANRIGDIEAQLAMQQAELARRRIEARADFLARGYTA